MSSTAIPNYYFRPALRADLPMVRDLHTYWLKNSFSVLDTEARSTQWWEDNFSRIRKERLPFFLAVCSEREFLSSELCRTPKWKGKIMNTYYEFPNIKLHTTAEDGTPEIMLGYAYALPFFPYPGYERTVEFSLYLIPHMRATGAQIGTRFEIQRALILRYPHLYPNYGWDGQLIRDNVKRMVSTTLLEPHERKAMLMGKLDKIWAEMRAVGLKHEIVGVAEEIGEKFGKLLDMLYIGCNVEDFEPEAELMKGIHASTVDRWMKEQEMRMETKL